MNDSTATALNRRKERILRCLDVASQTGVEIGPLDRPVVRRSDGDVLYMDHLDTENLKLKYAGHVEQGLVDPGELVEVDLVADGRNFTEILGDRGPVDYVIASHVIEHIPDPIAWLCDIAEGLAPGGHVSLVVPDRRFTFDHFRRPSNAGELIGAFLEGRDAPTAGQIFDYVANVAVIDPMTVWKGEDFKRVPSPGHTPQQAINLARARLRENISPDVHCSVFTAAEFIEIFHQIILLDLLPYEIAAIEPTQFGEIEFFVTLRKSDAPPHVRAANVPEIEDLPPQGTIGRMAIVIPFSVPNWLKRVVPTSLKGILRRRLLRRV